MTQDVSVKLNSGMPWHAQHLTRRFFLTIKLDLNFREETSEVLHLE